MAWTCSGHNQEELVEKLVQNDILHNSRAADTLLHTDRKNFSPEDTLPYADAPQPIGYHQTISAPHMHAYVLDKWAEFLKPGARVLDVGSGSGYLAACFARMVGPTGKVIGIEAVPQLLQLSKDNVSKDDQELLESGVLSFQMGDGWKGLPEEAPFDLIHVGAAAEKLPSALCHQLDSQGGRLIVPIGPAHGSQVLTEIIRQNDNLERQELMGVHYVPLVKPSDIEKEEPEEPEEPIKLLK